MQKKKLHIPQEGEVVTWRQNQKLIVKAKLGARREHIPYRFDDEFYLPEREHYIGQFPVDYMPERFAKINEQEAMDLPKPFANQQLEFNLMLNGSIVQATDRTIFIRDGLDQKDQVKVMISNERLENRTGDVFESYEKSSDAIFDKKASDEYGLHCWFYTKTNSLRCYGRSSYKKSSGVLFKHMGGKGNWILAESWEPIYGGIRVQWSIDRRNLKDWKKVDAAIWRLLEIWNVSPFNIEKII